ncbi:MAG: ShlB/FhaC/HecB family hemolysin secretion/activation protein [Cyanobacteria bacterium P01_D01_bin.116]
MALAQSNPPSGITIPEDTPDTIERTIPTPAKPLPSPIPSPPPSELLPDTPSQDSSPTIPSFTKPFKVKKILVEGVTVPKLDKLIREKTLILENSTVTFADLLQLRSEITQLYIENKYVTSGAFIPNNQVINRNGATITIKVVEGKLEDVEISGLSRLRKQYVRSRIAIAAKQPLNQEKLERALQLLQLDPLIERVNAQLSAGKAPGQSILKLDIKEAPPFHAGVFTQNNQSPSIGSQQSGAFIAHDNLLGFGDNLNLQYGITEGLDLYDINYKVPINPRDGTINLRYSNTDSRIIEEPFQDTDIRSEAQTYSISYRQPLNRIPEAEFALELGLDLRRSQTFILNDIPFSFSEGPEDGESKVTAIRFSQDWVQRNAKRVLAARSQFSVGINAFDATVNDSGTDARFFSWLGQFQWVERLSSKNLLLARINAQLTPDSLLSLEKFSIGGINTVRGYSQNEIVSDNAVTASVEARFPLTRNSNALQIAPFFDVATSWNNRTPNSNPQTLAGLGLGLIWQPSQDLNLRLDYGIPLIAIDDRGDTLQDNGIYFSLQYQPF